MWRPGNMSYILMTRIFSLMQNKQLLPLTILLIACSCSSPENQLTRRVEEYSKQPSIEVISSGFDENSTPFILLTDGASILVDSLYEHATPKRVLSLSTSVNKVVHSLYFKNGEELAIRRKRSLPKPLRDIVAIPASDYFSRVTIAPIPGKQAFIISEKDGICFYYSLEKQSELFLLYGADILEAKDNGILSSVLVGNLNENELWYPLWQRADLSDYLNNRDHLFFVPVRFDSNMSLIEMSERLLYHVNEYPLSTLIDRNSAIAQVLEGDLRADRIRRTPTPMTTTTSANTVSNGASQSQSVKEDIDDVLEFLSIAGQFGIFTEEIDEISTALRIIDLFL